MLLELYIYLYLYYPLLIFHVVRYAVLIVFLLVLVSGPYTYIVNLHREADDPLKREYHLAAIVLIPLTIFLLIPFGILYFILRAIFFAGFLIIFTLLLLGIRKPFLLVWWDKIATKVGDLLLRANTRLFRLAFGR